MTFGEVLQLLQLFGPDLIDLTKTAIAKRGADAPATLATYAEIEAERAKNPPPLDPVQE